jgi:hypothetical protein
VLDAISKPMLEYETVLDLDKRIRDFSIPASLRNKEINTRPIVMQRASLSTALEAGTHRIPSQGFVSYLTFSLFPPASVNFTQSYCNCTASSSRAR